MVGQEQDALGGGFQTTQNFEGQLDELRFADVVRDADWVATEYANMGDVASFIATTTAEELNITDFVELDFWLQHFDSTADEADIWLQVADLPAGEETVIYMYYGATGASSASDELATFSYSTSTDLYYVVDNSGATSISVQSLIDNNEVSIDGGAPVTLHQGERTTFGTFTFLMRRGMGLEDILKRILTGFDVHILTDVEPVQFYCKCSKERFVEALKILPKTEILSMAEEDGQAEGRCHFCNEFYYVGRESLLDLARS